VSDDAGVRSTAHRRALDSRRVLQHLELIVTRRLDGMLHGHHQGLVPGSGAESGDSRHYVEGDDVRLIDWSVTARSGELHVRVPIIEHEIDTWLVVDLTASVQFGTAEHSKRELTLAAAAAWGFLNLRDGNRLGALLLSGEGTTVVPPGGGRPHLMRILDSVASQSVPSGPTALADALRRVSQVARRRGQVVVISDFLAEPEWTVEFRALAERHELLAVEVVDPRELDLPPVGVIDLIDPETGALVEAPTDDISFRRRYHDAAIAQRDSIRGAIIGARADHLQLRTDQDWIRQIATFVSLSHRRRTAASRAKPL
jgi:uncharacterized protein (DUF58 family)